MAIVVAGEAFVVAADTALVAARIVVVAVAGADSGPVVELVELADTVALALKLVAVVQTDIDFEGP